jgi:hypothetical protein
MGWRYWRGNQIINRTTEIVKDSINKALEDTLQESQSEVPLDEGILQHSGCVIMNSGSNPGGCVCYGGGAGTGFPIVPYAIRWHETQANFQHGRKRFYLRDPFNRVALRSFENNLRRNRL